MSFFCCKFGAGTATMLLRNKYIVVHIRFILSIYLLSVPPEARPAVANVLIMFWLLLLWVNRNHFNALNYHEPIVHIHIFLFATRKCRRHVALFFSSFFLHFCAAKYWVTKISRCDYRMKKVTRMSVGRLYGRRCQATVMERRCFFVHYLFAEVKAAGLRLIAEILSIFVLL